MPDELQQPDEPAATPETEVEALPDPLSAPLSTVEGEALLHLPKDELQHLAENLGLDSTRYKNRPRLAAAVHERRQLIDVLDRNAMLEVIGWGRRPVAANASKEQLAVEIARIQSMRFRGLSPAGLNVLARLRGVEISDADSADRIIRRLKRQEGFFSKLNRKRRGILGHIVASVVGESDAPPDYKFLPPEGEAPAPPPAGASDASIKREIEESGFFGGISNRIKRSADQYLNQKLDEIETRIDRKLDEIDRRLAEWRDKEIANRLRILKITLWASVIVAFISLIYAFVTNDLWPSK